MNCLDCQDLLSEYIDGDLKPNKRLLVSDHLKDCQECSLTHQDLKQIVGISQQLPLLVPKTDLWKKKLKNFLFQLLLKHKKTKVFGQDFGIINFNLVCLCHN